MRVKITYVDFHFDDGLTNVTCEAKSVDEARAWWFSVHSRCECPFIGAHAT